VNCLIYTELSCSLAEVLVLGLFARPAGAENFNHGKVFDEMVEEVLNNGKKNYTFDLRVFSDEQKKQKRDHEEEAWLFPGEEFVYRPDFATVNETLLEILLKENKGVFMSSLGPNKREQDFIEALQRYVKLNTLYSLRAYRGPSNWVIDNEIEPHKINNRKLVLLECLRLCFLSPRQWSDFRAIRRHAERLSDKCYEQVSWNNAYNIHRTKEGLKEEVRLCRDSVRYFAHLAVAINKKHKENERYWEKILKENGGKIQTKPENKETETENKETETENKA
jgi:hypothetical protein